MSRPADLTAPGLEDDYPHIAWFLSGDLDANTRTAVLEAGFWPGDPLFLDLIRDALAGQMHVHIRAADPVALRRACAAVRLLIEQTPPGAVH